MRVRIEVTDTLRAALSLQHCTPCPNVNVMFTVYFYPKQSILFRRNYVLGWPDRYSDCTPCLEVSTMLIRHRHPYRSSLYLNNSNFWGRIGSKLYPLMPKCRSGLRAQTHRVRHLHSRTVPHADAAASYGFSEDQSQEIKVLPRLRERDPFKVLGIPEDSDFEEVQAARNFLSQARGLHPSAFVFRTKCLVLLRYLPAVNIVFHD